MMVYLVYNTLTQPLTLNPLYINTYIYMSTMSTNIYKETYNIYK
jgi:hypothetical protein